MTLDNNELTTVLESADRYYQAGDYDSLYNLLHPVAEGNAVAGADLGRVQYYLGEACMGLKSYDAAMAYFEDATKVATGDYLTWSRNRIAELGRYDAAVDADAEGVEGEGEAKTVLATAKDALKREDYEEARRWYQSAWDGIHMTDQQVATAAIGLAHCAVHAGQLQDAESYLQMAEQRDTSAAAEIAELRQHIQTRLTGETRAADGVELGDVDQINVAAVRALRDGDLAAAGRLLQQLLDSDVLPGTERGRVWFNVGAMHVFGHDYDAAREAFQEAARTARPDIAQKAQDTLTKLDQNAAADEIVASLEPAEN